MNKPVLILIMGLTVMVFVLAMQLQAADMP